MSILGDELLFTTLERKHEIFTRYESVWQTISELREGATALLANIEAYLERRPDENNKDYQSRLKKFSYTPVMSTAIRETASKLAASAVYVNSGDEASIDFWNYFKEHNDREGKRDEHGLIQDLFLELLYNGRVYVVADRPQPEIEPRSQAEEAKLALPYLNIYPANLVYDWGDGWFKMRQVITNSTPTEIGYTVRWTYYLPEVTEIYEVPVLMDGNTITKVWNGNKFVPVRTKGLSVPITESIYHGLQRSLVAYAELPYEMWLGHMVYLKQIQHMRIESGWTDSGTLAGTIQRVFTPQAPVMNDNPAHLMETPDYDAIALGNRSVLVGSGFQFVESSGAAIANLSKQLDKIEAQIKAIVSMRFASADTSVLAQSGASKAADMEMLNTAMKDYGKRVAAVYQDALQNVAALIGVDPEIVSVQGLDTFGEDTLQDMLLNGVSIDGLSGNIPLTAQKIYWLKVAKKIAGTVAPEDDEKITYEAEVIFDAENQAASIEADTSVQSAETETEA